MKSHSFCFFSFVQTQFCLLQGESEKDARKSSKEKQRLDTGEKGKKEETGKVCIIYESDE